MQVKRPVTRRRRCKVCHGLFEPDSRTKGKQRYCSGKACQKKRQRHNEKDWRRRNPACLEEQYRQSRQWYKAHPDYSLKRRQNNPQYAQYNRKQTRIRMKKIRHKRLFDKSKSILLQLTGNKKDKCYLAQGRRWFYVRLTKASPLSRLGFLGDNRFNCKRIANRLPQGRLYDVTEQLFNQPIAGH